MAKGLVINKCIVSVDNKKYTKNTIKLKKNNINILFSKPNVYTGNIDIKLKNPNQEVTKIDYDGDKYILKFTWSGLLKDDNDSSGYYRTLSIKISFERRIDGENVYFTLIGKSIKKPKKTSKKDKLSKKKKVSKKK